MSSLPFREVALGLLTRISIAFLEFPEKLIFLTSDRFPVVVRQLAGDAVVVEGQGSLRPGAKVQVRPAPASATATAPSATPAPDPRPVPVLAQPNAATARVPGLE